MANGHIEHTGQGLRQEGLAGSGRPNQQNVRLCQFDTIAGALAIHVDTLVMVVDGDGQLLFGLLLPDDVFVEESLSLPAASAVGSGTAADGAAERSSSRIELQTATHSSQMYARG
jgi:hypothetical protein